MQKFFVKNVKKNKLIQLANPRRPPSPASPESFSTPEYFSGNEGSSVHSSNDHQPVHVPLHLDFDNRDSLSEWFPSSMLKVGDVYANPPNRDASLKPPETSNFQRHDVETSSERPLWNRSREKINFSTDDIIIIEPERPAPQPPSRASPEPESPVAESSNYAASRDESPGPSFSRRPVPNPIQIPFNPTISRVRIHRSPSVGANSSPFARTRESGPRAASRPVSSYSDDMSSAVSGSTLARDLVAGSFIISGNSRDSRYRCTLTRQDSATLPKGEHPFMNGSSPYWRDKRISNGEVVVSPEFALGSPVPPVPPIPSSAELSAMALNSATSSRRNSRRRNSIAGEEVVAAHDKQDQAVANEEVSEKPSGFTPKHRRANSLTRISRDQVAINRFSKISEASNSAAPSPTTPAKSPYSAVKSVKSLRESYSRGRASSESDARLERFSNNHTRGESTEAEPRSSNGSGSESATSHPVTSASVLSPDTAGSGSMYSMSSMGRSYTTQATSIKSPGSVASLYPHSANSRHPQRSPSEPLTAGSNNSQTRPTIILPHEDRPSSEQVPQTASPLSSRISEESMRLPFRPRPSPGPPVATPVDSPDLIEMMFGGVVQPVGRRPSRRRAGSQPPPMIFSPDLMSSDSSYSSDSPSTASAARQTFPETPYLFTPYTSSAFAPPPLRGSAQLTAPRMGSLNRGTGRTPLSSSQVFRHMSVSVASSSSSSGSRSARWPLSPPIQSASPSVHSIFSDPGSWSVESASDSKTAHHHLVSIEENSVPPTPMTQNLPRSRSSSPKPDNLSTNVIAEESSPSEPLPVSTQSGMSATTTPSLAATTETTETSPSLRSTAPGSRPVSELELSRPSSLVPSKRALSPAPSQRSQASELLDVLAGTSIEENGTLPPYFEKSTQIPSNNSEQLPPPYGQLPAAPTPEPSVAVATPPLQTAQLPQTPPRSPSLLPSHPSQPIPALETRTPPRLPRSLPRPAAPMGPRKPSGPSMLSLATSRARAGSVSSTVTMPTSRSVSSRQTSISAPAPQKFQKAPVRFKGLTMEAAQWTFSQQELQEVVSLAIKCSSDPSAIRLLPPDVFNVKLPAEIQRLETLSSELETDYISSARRRDAYCLDFKAMSSANDPTIVARFAQDLMDLQNHLDQVAEELVRVTDQLGQLKHLQDVHSKSALAMALRKLNASLVRHMADNKSVRDKFAILEAERDEAWDKAREMALQLEETQERLLEFGIQSPPASSRPSSRVTLARKASLATTKAGLRSPSRLRSQRSSAASSATRSSTMSSPSSRVDSEVPPVPRLPTLGINTIDLPNRSAGISSEVTPVSEIQAMVEAQREVMDMLGITDDTLSLGSGSLPRRRKSLSAVEMSPVSPKTRRNSEIVSPILRGTNMTDRDAVLAAIGMSSHPHEC